MPDKPDPSPIEAAILALQAQRAVLGDAVVDTAVATLRAQQLVLQQQAAGSPTDTPAAPPPAPPVLSSFVPPAMSSPHTHMYSPFPLPPVQARPLEDGLAEAIDDGKVGPRDDPKLRSKILSEEFGWDKEIAKKIWCFGPDTTGECVGDLRGGGKQGLGLGLCSGVT